ncbi:MAG: pectin acetylesterase-family hydrolase [Acidobacteriota bacterium]|nr:pectin acetylesterase-family hydrolase [Acidobacteriota bacterium]
MRLRTRSRGSSWVRRTSWIVGVVAISLSAACTAPEEEAAVANAVEEPSVFASLEPGWNTFEPGGETTCSDGSPFHFFARPGDPEKVIFYLQGGGGCWNGATCDRDGQPTYSMTAVERLIEAKPGEERPEGAQGGIFDYTRADNPLRDYSAVFVPYCTGDVHLGNRLAAYEAPAGEDHEAHEFTTEHKGAVNVRAALDWTFSAFASPETVFVTGSSAGSIPSPYYAHVIKAHYPSSRVVQLGDASGGYRRQTGSARPHEAWGTLDVVADVPGLAALASEEFNYERLYIEAGKANPDIAFAQFDNAEDGVQLRFLGISGAGADSLEPLLDANRADIAAAVPNFRAYTAGGDAHTILQRDTFYSLRVGKVLFRDWLAALVAGEPVDNVHCQDCSVAEIDT